MGLTQVSKDGVKNDAIDASKLPANSVGASELADNAVDTNAIADDAVTSAKIADATIIAANLASNSVTSGQIANNVITDAKINPSAAIAKSKIENLINNNADNRVITGSGTTNTLNGESDVIIDSSGNVGIGSTTINLQAANRTVLNLNGASQTALVFNRGNIITGFLYGANDEFRIQAAAGSGNTVRIRSDNKTIAQLDDDGLKFNNDTAAANALDDYEEGSWTPANSNMGVTVHYARYTKIGRMVHIVADVEFASSPADTSQVGFLGGLPFTNGNKSVHQHLPWFGTSAANDNQFFNTYFTPLIFANAGEFSFLNSNSGTYLTRAQLASKKVRINSTYYTSY